MSPTPETPAVRQRDAEWLDGEADHWLTCAEPVWDGPYRMRCGRRLVAGRCGRHGEVTR